MAAASPEPVNEGGTSLADHLQATLKLVSMLHDAGKMSPEFFTELLGEAPSPRAEANVRPLGRARKISVSMPEELTAAVQQRVGRGEFSQYVTEAVTRKLESDLLEELASLLEAEYGPVPERFLAEARAAWPDTE